MSNTRATAEPTVPPALPGTGTGIRDQIARLNGAKAAISSAITEKGVTVPAGTKLDGMAELIKGISGGGSTDEGWIGDGETHIWIHLEDGRTSPILGYCPNATVIVDWGDGTRKSFLSGSSTGTVQWTSHDYANPGDYRITLTVDGEVGFQGVQGTGQGSCILRYSEGADERNSAYQNAVKKIELGRNVTAIGNSAFHGCYSLTDIMISDNITSIGSYAFYACYSLQNITLPEGMTLINNSAFNNCHALASVNIPDGVTSIKRYTFANCRALASITIPNGVSSIDYSAFVGCQSITSMIIPGSVSVIDSYAFSNCVSVAYYDFTACTKVPALSDTNAFNNIAADCEIRIPAALYDEWSTAANWATYADHMVAA